METNKANTSSEVSAIYNHLYIEFCLFERHIKAFESIYLDSEDTVNMLFDIAPDFFGYLRYVLIDQLIISASRISDVQNSGLNNQNLTFEALKNVILKTANIDRLTKATLEENIGRLNIALHDIRKHRNKRVAHLDLQFATNRNENPLPKIDLKKLQEARALGFEILRLVSTYIYGAELSKATAPAKGGVASFLKAINKAYELKHHSKEQYYLGASIAELLRSDSNE